MGAGVEYEGEKKCDGRGGQYTDREGKTERERREGMTEGRDKSAVEEPGLSLSSGSLQATAQNRALWFFLFFPSHFSSSTVREKGEVSRGELNCRTQSSERQRELSRDEPGRVFKKAALLFEGVMAMEYGLPFQEGRMR